MRELPEQAADIMSIVLAVIIFLGLIIGCILLMYAQDKTDKMREEYIKKLDNDHDKAIILEYKNTRYHFKRKEKQK